MNSIKRRENLILSIFPPGNVLWGKTLWKGFQQTGCNNDNLYRSIKEHGFDKKIYINPGDKFDWKLKENKNTRLICDTQSSSQKNAQVWDCPGPRRRKKGSAKLLWICAISYFALSIFLNMLSFT